MNAGTSSGTSAESLASSVYEELKRRLNAGLLKPGEFIDLTALGRELGMSRTPLRDALIRLELEGFVVVYPRRGVMVRALQRSDIRDIYQIIGALEASVIEEIARRFRPSDADRMEALCAEMTKALDADDFDRYYSANLRFHDVYLELSDNRKLIDTVHILKERLYDFPRRSSYVKEWERDSMAEHAEICQRLRSEDFKGAAAYVRDVHWSFEVQERYIRTYYG
jgi:DNA-binding GntR family transcriptional regulator